jgi:hypothetical protein
LETGGKKAFYKKKKRRRRRKNGKEYRRKSLMTWAFEDSSTNWEARKSSYYCLERWKKMNIKKVIGPITNRRLMTLDAPPSVSS